MNFDDIFATTTQRPIDYHGKKLIRIDKIYLFNKKEEFRILFIETNSNWRQGVVLKTKGEFVVDNESYPNIIVLWEDTSPEVVNFTVTSKNKELLIYNVWDVGNGIMHYWHNGAAMEISKESLTGKVYNCNDGYPDEDFNDLVFSIETLTSPLKVLK